jgi:cytochrome c oxidase subunit 2
MKRLMPLFAVMALVLAGCGKDNLSVMRPQGPVARDQLTLIEISLGVMIFVFVVVIAIYTYVLFRYRKRKGDNSIPKQVEGNHVLEIIWTIIPILLLLVIAIPTVNYTFKHSHDYTKDKNVMQVTVTGHQFWWQFEYKKEGINTAQDLYIPVGKKVSFTVTSADVNHSFWVPSLGGKIDTNVGMNNVSYLQADHPGVYYGKCAELCGWSHALMEFKVIALEQADYDAWVNKMKTPVTVPADAAAGQQIFKDNCMSCHAVSAEGAGLGPNLTNFANRERVAGILEHNDQNIKNWVHEPTSQKPGAKMPAFKDLSDNQLNDLVKYLNSLNSTK